MLTGAGKIPENRETTKETTKAEPSARHPAEPARTPEPRLRRSPG